MLIFQTATAIARLSLEEMSRPSPTPSCPLSFVLPFYFFHLFFHFVFLFCSFLPPQESFLLELITDLASCPETTSGDALSHLADKLLNEISKSFLYASAPTVNALVEVNAAILVAVGLPTFGSVSF